MMMYVIEEIRFLSLNYCYCYCYILFVVVLNYVLVYGPAQVVTFSFCFDYYPRYFALLERCSTFLLFQNHPT